LIAKAIHIAVDVMGGDYGPSVTVPAVIKALSESPALTVTLLGRTTLFEKQFNNQLSVFGDRVRYIDCADEVGMDEKPSYALRHKKESSMFLSVAMVGRNEADACVSAGNTGALMAIGMFVIKTFRGIDRPAVCAEMPTEKGSCLMLDLGANVDCRAEHLSQFAVMGSVMANSMKQINHPKIGLLNIGEEESKGNEQVRLAAGLLEKNKNINYIGFIEGDDIYKGDVDVVICDGFVGNAVLKASEGVARLVGQKINQSIERSWLTKVQALLSRSLFKELQKQIDPSRYNGASILGLRKVIIVSHGKADIQGFCNAILLACRQVEEDLPEKIQLRLS